MSWIQTSQQFRAETGQASGSKGVCVIRRMESMRRSIPAALTPHLFDRVFVLLVIRLAMVGWMDKSGVHGRDLVWMEGLRR